MRSHRLTAALILVASAPAFAWGPYGPDAARGATAGPAVPWQGAPPFGWVAPFGAPYQAYGPPPVPFGVASPGTSSMAGPVPPGVRGPSSDPVSQRPGSERRGPRHLSIARRATPDDYLIEIRLRNIDPNEVQVAWEGRGLRIGYRTYAADQRLDSFEAGSRRFTGHFSGSASQLLGLPPDADPAGMSREVTEQRIRLRIPRLNRTPSGFGPRLVPPGGASRTPAD